MNAQDYWYYSDVAADALTVVNSKERQSDNFVYGSS